MGQGGKEEAERGGGGEKEEHADIETEREKRK